MDNNIEPNNVSNGSIDNGGVVNPTPIPNTGNPAPTPQPIPVTPAPTVAPIPVSTPTPTPEPVSTPVENPVNTTVAAPAVTQVAESKKGNSKIFVIIGIVVALLVIIGGVLFFVLRGNRTGKDKFDLTSSESFFFSDYSREGHKIALVSKSKGLITDFIFDRNDDFFNGVAVVEADGKYGVVDSNGKMIVEFGKYKSIEKVSGMFYVSTDKYERYLIDNTGKVILDLKDYTLEGNGDYYVLLKNETKKTYELLNYEGKSLLTVPIISSDKEPDLGERNSYVEISYNGKFYVFDTKSSKEILNLSDGISSDKIYDAYKITDDGMVIIHEYMKDSSYFSEATDNRYFVYKNGNVYNLPDECNDDIDYEDGFIICKNHLVTEDFKLGWKFSTSQSITYKDSTTYAIEHDGYVGSKTGVDFYENGKFIKNIPCSYIPDDTPAKDGLYLLVNSTDDECKSNAEKGYAFYNTKGEKVFNTTYTDATSFRDGKALVSEDDKTLHIIDTKGKTISDDYTSLIHLLYDTPYYYAYKDKKAGLVDENGKVVIDIMYKSITGSPYSDEIMILEDSEGNYIVYNIKLGKEVYKGKEEPIFGNEEYFSIYTDEKILNYTCYGKMFFEEDRD